MQRVAPGISNAFVPAEKALWDTFVPAMFEGLGEGPLDWTASCVITGHLVAALRGQV